MKYAFTPSELDKASEAIWSTLFGLGSVSKKLAFSQATRQLANAGLIDQYSPRPGTRAYSLVKTAFDTALKYSFLDAPDNGHFRAILTDPDDYESEDWQKCVIGFMGEYEQKRFAREEIIKGALGWAKENLGLETESIDKDSIAWRCVEEALNQAIKDKIVSQTVFYGVERLQLAQ